VDAGVSLTTAPRSLVVLSGLRRVTQVGERCAPGLVGGEAGPGAAVVGALCGGCAVGGGAERCAQLIGGWHLTCRESTWTTATHRGSTWTTAGGGAPSRERV
jgi:hypothetical protein